MEEPIIQIENITKTFGTLEALKGVSLNVNKGEVVVIIGPSGSGKSTLLRCINRLEEFDSGSIVVDGIPLDTAENINAVRTEVGMVFQQFNLFPHLTVLRNITLAQEVVRKRNKAEAEAKAMQLLGQGGHPRKSHGSTRTSSQAGSSSAWPSPAPWQWIPRSCCLMNRPARWTQK